MKNRSEPESRPILRRPIERFLSSRWSIGLALFAIIGLLNLSALRDPPSWDGAMGVHPAAITLSKTGFDLPGLLRAPTYMQGGPNTHSLSLVTWLTALFYRSLTGSDWLFPLMHVCHFAIGAVALLNVYRFARLALGDVLAMAVCGVVVCNPIVLAQCGCLYLEIPLMASTLAALVAWSDRRWRMAAFWTLVTFYIKETGLILAGALTAAALIESGAWRGRIGRAVTMLAPSIVAFCLNAAMTRPAGATPYVPSPYREYLRFDVIQRLMPVPDLCAALVLFMLVTLVRAPTLVRGLRRPKTDDMTIGDTATEGSATMSTPVALSHLMILSFFGFFLAAHFAGEVYLLPRYFVQIIPCLALTLVDAARRIAPQRVVLAGTILCSLVFLANREGAFYAGVDTNDGSAAERSMEYRDLFKVQQDALTLLETTNAPVFYGLPEHFLCNYPEMGFVRRRPTDGHCVLLDAPYDDARLADFPAVFYLVLDYPALGGQRLMAVLDQASRQGWNVRRAGYFRAGHYRVALMECMSPAASQRSQNER